MSKILISPGFGAGWSTWADGDHVRFCLTYEPFIKKLENGDKLTEEDGEKFIEDLIKECGKSGEYFYMGGMCDLEVVDVDGPFHVHEYDGHESLNTPTNMDWMEL